MVVVMVVIVIVIVLRGRRGELPAQLLEHLWAEAPDVDGLLGEEVVRLGQAPWVRTNGVSTHGAAANK